MDACHQHISQYTRFGTSHVDEHQKVQMSHGHSMEVNEEVDQNLDLYLQWVAANSDFGHMQ